MNQFRATYILLFLSATVLTSCLNDVELSSESDLPQLVVLAEFEEGLNPRIRISTTFDVNTNPEEIDSDSARVVIRESTSNFEELREARPLGNDLTSYQVPSEIFPTPGETYMLDVEVPNPEILPIFGETTMPIRGNIDLFNNISLLIENDDFTEIAVSLNLGDTPDPNSFYHLIPFIIDNNGSEIFPDISRINTGENAALVLSHRDGMLIDINNLDNTNLLEFQIRSLFPLDVNQLTDKNLYFKLNTVAEEYFLYHSSISRQFETNQSPFTIPSLSYSQFENGYGIFTAFSTETFKSEIN
ncbi:DUF4249 domain-containing protein [Saprospiraceae bacterium]|nr:DUF4249 domain-containing protein [Saprospiraceae bacterium]